jgi:hypothetical protein
VHNSGHFVGFLGFIINPGATLIAGPEPAAELHVHGQPGDVQQDIR